MMNGDVSLGAELVYQPLHRIWVHDFVIHAVKDDTR